MIDSRLKRAESNRGGDGDIYSESTLDLMPLFEGSTPKSKQRARIDALIKHSKVGTTRDSMRRASLTELCDTKEHYLEMSATIFEGLDFDENVGKCIKCPRESPLALAEGVSPHASSRTCCVQVFPEESQPWGGGGGRIWSNFRGSGVVAVGIDALPLCASSQPRSAARLPTWPSSLQGVHHPTTASLDALSSGCHCLKSMAYCETHRRM